MVDAFKLLITIILLVVGFVVYPTLQKAEDIHDYAYETAKAAITNFVDVTRSKGYVDNRDYNIFIVELGSSGLVFDVYMEHYKKRYQPLYDTPTNYFTFQDNFEVIYEGYYTQDILDVLYPATPLPEDHVDRRYNMSMGDLFNVRIESTQVGLAHSLRSIYTNPGNQPVAITYGGMVRNEAP